MALDSQDVRRMQDSLDENLRLTTQIHTVLFPAPGQPNAIQVLSSRVTKLEGWRAFLSGAWAMVTFTAGWFLTKKWH